MTTDFIQGAGGCFSGSTPIYTPKGFVCIDLLKEGEEVYSFDQFGKLIPAKILKVHVHENETVFDYTVWGRGTIRVTPNHWVLNQFNAFVQIHSIGPDDCLVDINNHLRPIIDRKEIGLDTVYNLTVEGQHTFIAGGIRVHNAGLGLGVISGEGGGKGGGGGGGDVSDDNLDSKAYARIVDLISEGEIEGFPSARDYPRSSGDYEKMMLKDIFLDKTPILQKSAKAGDISKKDYNFKGVKVRARYGTATQNYLPGFSNVEAEYSVGVIVKDKLPVTRTITDDSVDAVRVTLNWDQFQKLEDDGDISGTSVSYKIEVNYNGTGWQTKKDKKLKGRSGDKYQKSLVVRLNGPFPVDIRVSRGTKDPKTKTLNEFSWLSYTEITYAKLTYKHSAIVGLEVDSKNFSNVPTRSYRIRGIRVKIPSNATVNDDDGSLVYTGVWDGTFQSAVWCADPAWCLWDLLTDCRYGLGQNINTKNLDKWSFYAASVYCNQLVDSGQKTKKGEVIMEPRFLCNVNIQNSDEAYKLINDMCSVFRAMPYWSTGALMLAQDRPTDATFLFNQTNVSAEGFQYSGSSLKTRHTVAIVSYLDIGKQEIAYEAVEDKTGIAKYGVITTQIEGFACTSRSQAHRLGEWLLYTEQYETETVTFKASIEGGIGVRPGSVIAISDPLRAGLRRGGRIRSYGAGYVIVDEPLDTDMPVSGAPKLLIAQEDGTVGTYSVSSVAGAKVMISGSFTVNPLVGGAFIFNNDLMVSSYWRVLSLQEENGSEYVITAMSYNKSKYDYIERGAPLTTETYFPIPDVTPQSPENVNAEPATYESSGQLQNKIAVSWQSDPAAVQYEVRYRQI